MKKNKKPTKRNALAKMVLDGTFVSKVDRGIKLKEQRKRRKLTQREFDKEWNLD